MLRSIAATATLAALALIGITPVVQATPGNGVSELCPDGVNGWELKVDFDGDGPDTYPYTAPEGYVVVETCVKAGTTTFYDSYSPGVDEVTLDHPDKDSISHYAVRLEEKVVPPEEVTPAAPEWTDICGPDNAAWILPEGTEAYSYSESTDGEYLVVTATAAEGYVFPGGETTMMWKDKDSGVLCEEPPVDVCKNLEGVQTEVPEGYKSDGNGNCCTCTPPPPVDKCFNIDGEQTMVPEGMTRDGDGNCWPPKPDTKVEYGEWNVSDYMCTTEKVKETREVTTTTYVKDAGSATWKAETTVETETRMRAMTEDEVAELCPPPPPTKVFVCKYVGTPGVDERLQTGNNPIAVDANSIKDWVGEVTEAIIGFEFADAQGRSVVIGIKDWNGGGQTGEPTIEDCPQPPVDVCPNLPGDQESVPDGLKLEDGACVMPPMVTVSDWSGEPECGMETFIETATETTTTFVLKVLEDGYEFQPVVTYKALFRNVKIDDVIPCEDASASITVTPATCTAAGGIAEVSTEFATLVGELEETPGMHEATFTADAGHAFPGGDTMLTVEYTLEDQLTEGCEETPVDPTLDGSILGEVCSADAPFLFYDIVLTDPDNQSTDDGTATITFVHPTDPSENFTTTVPIGQGRILWPGASLDANGVANNWPGWEYDAAADEWVSVGDENFGWTRQPNTEVLLTVNPSTSFQVSYPPATPECNSEPPRPVVSVLDAPPATPVTGVVSYTG